MMQMLQIRIDKECLWHITIDASGKELYPP
jgi:hypothetical protein